jgi:7-carboxy-7-deazaguanine synthase
MRISEIFYSIQGEGTLVGVPSVFIRTAGCNLSCRWCDSIYASRHAQGNELTTDNLLEEVNRYPTRFCVITGGEPMLAKGINDLAKRLIDGGKHVTIETAATIPPQGVVCSLASLSPKLSNSTPGVNVSDAVRRRHEEQRLQPEVIRDWIDNYNYQLKFVICSCANIAEVLVVLGSLDRNIAPEKVLLMPEGVDTSAFTSTVDIVVEACKEHGFRFCDRLHVRLYGTTRGR